MNKKNIFLLAIVAFLFTFCKKEEVIENKAPVCTIISPKNKAEISLGETVTIATNSEDTDGSIKEVRFYIGGVGVGSASQFPYNYIWETESLEEGTYKIKAEATDDSNAKNIYEIQVTLVDNSIKTITGIVKNSLNLPVKGAEITGSIKSAIIGDKSNNNFRNSQNLDSTTILSDIKTGIKKPSSSLEDWIKSGSVNSLNIDSDNKQYTNPVETKLLKSGASNSITDENGYFEISGIEYGNYDIQISHDDYDSKTLELDFSKQTGQQEISLTAKELPQISSLSLSGGEKRVNVNWTGINKSTLKGYNNYMSSFVWYRGELSEDKDNFYYEYSPWVKTNSSLLENSATQFSAENYNAIYLDYVLPVNIDNVESKETNSTNREKISTPKKSRVLKSFGLTNATTSVYIPDNSNNEIALHMRYYYTDASQTLQMDNWKVQVSTNGSSWTTIATHNLPSGYIPMQYYGYTKTFSLNSYKGKTVNFKTSPESFPSPANAFTIENIVVEYSQDGNEFEPIEPPVAEFTANNTTIKVGETVSFTDQSTNNPSNWNWNFGNNSTSTNQNPSHTYNTPGIYTVSLLTSNSVGVDEKIKEGYIKVTTDEGSFGEPGTFTDSRDNRTYNTVKIGNQWWMADNLSFDVGNGSWTYNDKESILLTYGRLYTWESAKKACPAGWHLPSNNDWMELVEYLTINGFGYSGSGDDIAKSLAAKTGWNSTAPFFGYPGIELWKNNSSGFSALPGGLYSPTFGLLGILFEANFWSVSSYNQSKAYRFSLNANSSQTSLDYGDINLGHSVRCIKD